MGVTRGSGIVSNATDVLGMKGLVECVKCIVFVSGRCRR